MNVMIQWCQEWIDQSPKIRNEKIKSIYSKLDVFSDQMNDTELLKTVHLFFDVVKVRFKFK